MLVTLTHAHDSCVMLMTQTHAHFKNPLFIFKTTKDFQLGYNLFTFGHKKHTIR